MREETEDVLMGISPISSQAAVYAAQGAQSSSKASQSAAPAEQAADTVKLSKAALAHLQGADADGDHDGH